MAAESMAAPGCARNSTLRDGRRVTSCPLGSRDATGRAEPVRAVAASAGRDKANPSFVRVRIRLTAILFI